MSTLKPYSKFIAAVIGLVVFVFAQFVGLDLGEVPGLAIDADTLVQGIVAAIIVLISPKNTESAEPPPIDLT